MILFKTSVITDEISQDLDVAIELAVKHGLDAIEIRSVYDKDPFSMKKEDFENIAQKAKKAKLKVSAISAPFFKCSMDSEEEVEAHLLGLQRCIDGAKVLETKYIRGFAFWKNGELTSCIDKIVSLYEKAIQIIKDEDVCLVLESEPSVNTGNAKELAQVLKAINNPKVKALWDPGNNLYSKTIETPYPDGYNYVKDYVEHVHLKDALINENNEADGCRLGEGLVDFKGQFNALQNDNYDGYVVVETHYRKNTTLSKEILERPGGTAFSADGYEPSEECIISMMELLNNK